ncbi:MAG TPA: response regulator transcription factor [Solirubrobacterales bacterium]|nr:response regulator transcription factor [Solirubrobacterales bacterium]
MIDGHPLVRLGIRETIASDYVVHEAPTRDDGIDLIRDIGDFDVAIVDMRWRRNGNGSAISGPEAIRLMHRSAPGLGIVAHGELPERHLVSAALQAGASAYVARTADLSKLRLAVDAAVSLERFVDPDVPPQGSRGKVTQRQRQILQLLADGESTTVAARELDLSEETVKTHTKNALARLGARNRAHAVAIAIRECLID